LYNIGKNKYAHDKKNDKIKNCNALSHDESTRDTNDFLIIL